MTEKHHLKHSNLNFEEFRRRACDPSLSAEEKIGFPDAYRAGKGGAILNDIIAKASNLTVPGRRVLDIGIGCGELGASIAQYCKANGHSLTAIDSPEMLANYDSDVRKIGGRFPEECEQALGDDVFDVIIIYSVLQYVFADQNIFAFVDVCLSRLADGGQLLIGDIPNTSMRKRFLASPAGLRHHQASFDPNGSPNVTFNVLEPKEIDDGVLLGVLARCRAAGFHAFLLPQPMHLPMANRREDMVVIRP
ncbi:class I SAM-dependent methyltransferase [Novispirillum itersonii]|uniref:class I SAM-dependent methyltransferase n=1 Tax=Novispirillum itersonii TaxID=189 RepID=UPI000379D284|nr:class I SAM-dependent methyltransferase [Novispirillum itersonii]